MFGLGPQLETGEKKGEVGLRISGEKLEEWLLSVKKFPREFLPSEGVPRYVKSL